MEAWDVIIEVLQKRTTYEVLLFVGHTYHEISMKQLAEKFDVTVDSVSKVINDCYREIQVEYELSGNEIGRDKITGKFDGHLIGTMNRDVLN